MTDLIVKDKAILKQVSEDTTVEEAKEIIEKLKFVLDNNLNGIGLSAIQIGIPKNVFILRKDNEYLSFINPKLIDKHEKGMISAEEEFIFNGEGCLSFPNVFLSTKRYKHYTIEKDIICEDKFEKEINYFYYSSDSNEISDGILAIAVQHEMDHLSGLILPEYGSSSVKFSKKLGRNDPCPCGSGKKYKKCCG